MNIVGATIKNFMNLICVHFSANGKHIILRGKNGVGKTAFLKNFFVALFGAKVLPNNPITYGQESTENEWHIGEGEQKKMTIRWRAKPEGKFDLTLYHYLPDGSKAEIKKPTEYIKSLILKESIDPAEFWKKSDKEQLEMFFKLHPELQSELERIELEKLAIQTKRSDILREKEGAEHELEKYSFTPGLPDEELDSVELLAELEKAKGHNQNLDRLKSQLNETYQSLNVFDDRVSRSQYHIDQIRAQIDQLEKNISETQEYIRINQEEKERLLQKQGLIEQEITQFKEVPIEPIQQELSNLNETNKKIRDNQTHKKLTQDIERLKEAYSQGLEAMRNKDQEKIDVIKSVKMPLEGLTIGDNCLMYPDPISGNLVPIKQLSSGQQWPVVFGILEPFLPPKDKGMRIFIVNSVNDLDKGNRELLERIATEKEIQLIIHETVYDSYSNQVEISIIDE